jgi:inorganic phosphate transporter, PiT family
MWQLSSGVFLGWSLGSNDASNVFGTAVSSNMVRFRTAAILCAVFVVIGALIGGRAGLHTYSNLSTFSLETAFLTSLASALTVTMMTRLGLPVSTSQAVVGALCAVGIAQSDLNTTSLVKVVICWIGTPIGGLISAVILYRITGWLLNALNLNLFQYDRALRAGLIIAGSYGAYALGANNVANVTGAFCGEGMLSPFWASLIGGLSIAVGVLTYSKHVMYTVGRDLIKLSAYPAFIVVLAEAATVHLFAEIGVPVSTSQAVVGAAIGVGIAARTPTFNYRVLAKIGFGWVGTPAITFIIALVFFYGARAIGLV